MNQLIITKQQYEQLINLPVVKNCFTYVIQDNSKIVNGKIISKEYKKWIKFAGIEFVVEDADGV